MTRQTRAGGVTVTPALAGGSGVLASGLGAEPAEPGHPLSYTHFQHREPDLSALVSASFATLAARPSLHRPSTRLPVGSHYLPCPALEGGPQAMGMFRGFGVAPLRERVEMVAKTCTPPPCSSAVRAGLASCTGGPDWALLSRVSARRGAGPGRIPRAEGGRAEFGARGRGPAGVQRTHTGLVAWRARGPLWTLSRAPGAGEAGPESRLETGVSQRAPRGTERPLHCALISRRSRRHCVARGRPRNHAVRAAEVSAWAGGRARRPGAVR